jgi:N-acetylglucosaminyl-diphospho-decaprenol L-rhamnosyltransferase
VTIGAVVLHYRQWPEVRRCLDALHAQTLTPDEVVVVDNASGDGSATLVRDAYPWARLVEAAENLGYGAGMNLGMSALSERNDAVLLLTHECVLAPDALEIRCARMRADPRIGAVGPLIGFRSDPDRVYSAGGWVDPTTWRPRHFREPADLGGWVDAEPREVAWLDGSALLLRRAAVESSGPFDEGYFMYFEETDLLLRLGQAGWRVECVPRARAWQEPGPKPKYLWTRNRLRFLARRAPRRALLREVVQLLRRSIRPSAVDADGTDRRRAELSALIDFALRRHGPPPERHRPVGSAPVGGSNEGAAGAEPVESPAVTRGAEHDAGC